MPCRRLICSGANGFSSKSRFMFFSFLSEMSVLLWRTYTSRVRAGRNSYQGPTLSAKGARMGLGIRVFLIDDDDKIRRFPYTRFDRLISRESDETLPEFANRTVRCAIVFLETIDRQPGNVRNLDFLILEFDKHGRLDRKVQEQQLH